VNSAAVRRRLANRSLRLELLENRLQPGSILPVFGSGILDPVLGDWSGGFADSRESLFHGVSQTIVRRDMPEYSVPLSANLSRSERATEISAIVIESHGAPSVAADGRLMRELQTMNVLGSRFQQIAGANQALVSLPTVANLRHMECACYVNGAMVTSHSAPGVVRQFVTGANQETSTPQLTVQSSAVSVQPMDFSVVKHYGGTGGIAPDADLEWSTYVTGSPTTGTGRGVAVDSGGNSYVTGFTGNGPDRAGFVAKYANTGRQIYYTAFQAVDRDPGFTYMETEGHGISVDPAGNVYLTGTATRLESGNRHAFALKFDGFGNMVPNYGGGIAYSPNLDSSGDGIAVTSGGLATVTGSFQVSRSETEIFAVKFNASGLSPVYAVGYQFPGFDGSAGKAITLDSSGDNIYLAGSIVPTGGDNDILIMKVDNTGPMAGSHASYALTAQNVGDDTLNGIAVNSAGNAYVIGTVTDGGQLKAYLAEITVAGDDLEFAQIYDGTMSGTSLAIDIGGNSYFTGAVALDDGSIHALVAKVDLQGEPVDTTALAGDTTEVGAGLAFRSGSVYLTGTTSSTNLSTDTTSLIGSSDAYLAKIVNFS